MSVTITLTPFALYYIIYGAHIATVTGVAAGALLSEIDKSGQKSKDFQLWTKQNQGVREELNRILYPNLYAAQHQQQNAANTAEKQAALNEIPQTQAFVRKTFVQDLDITRKTAELLGAKLLPISEGVAFLYKDCGFVLFRSETSVPFDLWILGAPNAESATQLAEEIETEYKRRVQDHVHSLLLQRSSEYGLQLESEEIQPDQSVVLTFTV